MVVGVLFLVIMLVGVLSVPLAGGRLSLLADLRLRAVGLLSGALLVQVLILAVLSDGNPTILGATYVATFVAAGAFLWLNRRIPGILLLGLGGALNATAIIANGGVMPARAGALEAAGRPIVEDRFRNSTAVTDPHLPWLGDTFAIPSGVPLANVFSVGDVVIALGAFLLLHAACNSRLSRIPVPSRRSAGQKGSPRVVERVTR